MKTAYVIKIIGLLLFFGSLQNSYGQQNQKEINKLIKIMTGSFNSEKQSIADTTYYNISLHMYPIWENDAASWLYVEQALNSKQGKPYRQRVYKVEYLSEGKFKTTIFKLKDEKNFIGKWKSAKYFNQFDATILEERSGCEVYLDKINNNVYEGATLNDNCESSLRGASYATSKVKIAKDAIYSWDQGFDQENKQVWGAKKEGYTFNKLQKTP